LAKELERVGIATAHVCSIIPVARMVGSNRIVAGSKIVNPLGNADLDPQEEKELRRAILERALEALQADVKEQSLFDQPTAGRPRRDG
jgi:glycine reductase complex component B subunit gamma